MPCLRKTISRLSDLNAVNGGLVVWSKMRWYPILLSMYSGGIGAIASQNYEMLAALFLTKVTNERRGRNQTALLAAISEF